MIVGSLTGEGITSLVRNSPNHSICPDILHEDVDYFSAKLKKAFPK